MDGSWKGRSRNAQTNVHPPRQSCYRGAMDDQSCDLSQTQTDEQYIWQTWICEYYRSLYAIHNFMDDFYCKFHLAPLSSKCKMQIALWTFNKLHVSDSSFYFFFCLILWAFFFLIWLNRTNVLSYCLNMANSCEIIMKKDIWFCFADHFKLHAQISAEVSYRSSQRHPQTSLQHIQNIRVSWDWIYRCDSIPKRKGDRRLLIQMFYPWNHIFS